MLGVDPFRLALGRLAVHQVVQPQVAPFLEGDVAAGALVDDDVA
jgi:hypothetical protein